jgi:hypothetical protein
VASPAVERIHDYVEVGHRRDARVADSVL